jgi:excisionase family DNA binding protein
MRQNANETGVPELLTVEEASQKLRHSPSHIYDLFDRQELEGFRSGRSIRIFLWSVADYIQRNRNARSEPPKPAPTVTPTLTPPRPSRPPGLCLVPPPPP